jgi:hypothetical protein
MRATEPTRERALPRRLALALHPRRDVADALETVVGWAAATGIDLVGRDDPRLHDTVLRRPDAQLARDCDLVLALGGDGTMLGAMRLAAPHGVPVLGANLGRLGYLTEVDGRHLPEALAALAAGAYAVEERFALRAEWLGEDGRPRDRVAYNDIVLSRVPGRGQAALGLSVDGQLLVRYASDGVIAATPGGSTGYSFAAGGPIVSPQTRATIVTPDSRTGCSTGRSSSATTSAWGSRCSRRARPSPWRSTASCSRAWSAARRSPSPRTTPPRSWCAWARPASPSARAASSGSRIRRTSPTSTWPGTSADPAPGDQLSGTRGA